MRACVWSDLGRLFVLLQAASSRAPVFESPASARNLSGARLPCLAAGAGLRKAGTGWAKEHPEIEQSLSFGTHTYLRG